MHILKKNIISCKDEKQIWRIKKMIYPKICKIVRITAGAAKQRINLMNRKNCFEIFGYDFMIDENFNPFLIEINTNPGLEFSSPLIRMCIKVESDLEKIENDIMKKRNNKYSDLFNTYLNKKLGSSQKITIPQTHYNGKNLWILKAVNLNRGMCIKVESDLEKIENDIMQIKEHYKMDNLYGKKKKCKRIILQKYIEKPLLYHGRKFDIRLWVLFIGNQPDFVYVFKEGHLKATCEQYDSNSTDLYIHLTNYSVQKHNAEFSKIEIGNEIPFKDLQKQFEDNNINVNFKKMIYPKICKIVRITAGAAKQRINLMNRKNCFEIFGYDFMIDENFNPFLIEINTNPGLEFSSPLIRMLLPRLIDDAFKLTIDQEFFSSNIFSNMPSPFPVEGYSNEENMFDK